MGNIILSVSGLTKRVSERTILSNISFSIEKKSLISIIGPNGAGKSTLIKILLGFDKQYSGSVSINTSEKFAYIPQMNLDDLNPIPLSVREYITIGTTKIYSKTQSNFFDLHQALEHVGVSADKLNQIFWSLSGGERQRIAIARALLSEPTVLVLDEPLSAVDYASREKLYTLIRHLQKSHNITVILVSHDIDSVLPISDRVLCLNQVLHTDCHPCDYINSSTGKASLIHHRC